MIHGEFFEDRHFEGLRLIGEELSRCEFDGCVFRGCRFESCELRGCRFSACTFEKCEIINPKLDGCEMVSGEFYDCLFVGVNWSGLRLRAGRFFPADKAERCVWRVCSVMDFDMAKFNFSESRFEDCIFQQCGLSASNFTHSRFEGTVFSRCDLSRADFRGAAGYTIDLSTNKLTKARFSFPEVVGLLSALDIKID